MFTVAETKLFTRIVESYLTEEEYGVLQMKLAADPDQGAVVPGTGGVRKLRWGQPGRGKRGGVRVIYYLKRADRVIWMLTIYAKNEANNVSAQVLRKIREEVDG